MAKNFMNEMPWGGILRRTAQIAGVVLLGLTGLGAAGVRQERLEKRESERFRWTDKNRWE